MPKLFRTSTVHAPYSGISRPPNPTEGLQIFARKRGLQQLGMTTDNVTRETILQPHIAERSWMMYHGFVNSAAIGNLGTGAPSTLGTITARTNTAADVLTSMKRTGFVSAAGAGSLAEIRCAASTTCRGTTTTGGFYMVAKFGLSLIPAGRRWFVGLAPAGAATNIQPSAQVNILGVGQDTADTNIFFMHNDASGVATRNNGSATLATPTTAKAYQFSLYCPPGGTEITMALEDLGTGNYTELAASTDLPPSATMLAPKMWMTNNATASACAFDLGCMYLEMPY